MTDSSETPRPETAAGPDVSPPPDGPSVVVAKPAEPAVAVAAEAAGAVARAEAPEPAGSVPPAATGEIDLAAIKPGNVIVPGPVKAAPPKPSRAARLRAFAAENAHAAGVVLFALGCGWLVGANSFSGDASGRGIAAAIGALDAKIDAVAARAAARDDVAALLAGADEVRTELAGSRDAAASLARVSAKLERLDRDGAARFERMEKEQSARLDRFAERLDRVERAAGVADETASIPRQVPPPSPPAAVSLGLRGGETRASREPPSSARGYVLREVRGGVALVDGHSGQREVAPGDTLPGAGRVRSIERRRGQWVVVTSRGVIDAAGE